jgi:DNA polymerase-3 subunit delta
MKEKECGDATGGHAMKISPAQIATFLSKLDDKIRAVLVYGPDGGLVRERARHLARSVLGDDLANPFRCVTLYAEALFGDPARLVDEAAALSLTGGRRVVLVREAGDSLTPVFKSFLSDPVGDSLVIAEGGELQKRSSLRKTFEDFPAAAALPCYADEGAGLASVIEETLRGQGISASREALAYLSRSLGSDRSITRTELIKLALYVGDKGVVELDDALACTADSSALSLDDVACAVGGGDIALLEKSLGRVFLEGVSPIQLFRWTAGHFRRLHFVGGQMARGMTVDAAMAKLRPPLFFKVKDKFRSQLRIWPPGRVSGALGRLMDAERDCKTTGFPAEVICHRTLLALAASVHPAPKSPRAAR